jgi:hypothetical protein
MQVPALAAALVTGLVWLPAPPPGAQPLAIMHRLDGTPGLSAVAADNNGGPRLGVSGSHLTVDGQERFLIGVSLFDALGLAGASDEDLDALVRWRISLVRVWAHWKEPIYGADGALSPGGRERLARLVQRLESRGLLLELVLLRPGQLPGEPYAIFASREARLRAVGEIAAALKGHRGILFDLCNEHDHRDGPISHAEARTLRDAVKAIDPARIVTISSTEYHFLAPEGTIGLPGLTNLREEIEGVGVDLVAAHLPRTPDWAAVTSVRVARLRKALESLAHPLPLHLSEERRAQAGEKPLLASVYQTAVAGSRAAGAAGWVFHTEAGFALGRHSFSGALSAQERAALEIIGLGESLAR